MYQSVGLWTSGHHSMHANEAGDRVSRQGRRHDYRIREFLGTESVENAVSSTTAIAAVLRRHAAAPKTHFHPHCAGDNAVAATA